DFEASTMNGSIASSFPLATRSGEPAAHGQGSSRGKKIVVQDEDGETTSVDVGELEREIEESMRESQREVDEGVREEGDSRRETGVARHIQVVNPMREYRGSIGKGGAQIRMTTLNGTLLLLTAGSQEADAKPLVSSRRTFTVTVPDVRVDVHVPPVHVPPVH